MGLDTLLQTQTYRGDVNQTGEEANDTDNSDDNPALPVGKVIANDGDDATSQRHCATNAQSQQHDEEEDRK